MNTLMHLSGLAARIHTRAPRVHAHLDIAVNDALRVNVVEGKHQLGCPQLNEATLDGLAEFALQERACPCQCIDASGG